jgi:hypothetical protein
LARLSLFWHATLQHFIVCVVLALELSWLALIQPATPPFWYAWRMERVTVRTFLQAHSRPAKFGAEYVRANGQRTIITTGELACSVAKFKATKGVHDCEWEPGGSVAIVADGFLVR